MRRLGEKKPRNPTPAIPGVSCLRLGFVRTTIVANRRETVGRCVREAIAALQGSATQGEVIVADDGSTDGSRKEKALESSTSQKRVTGAR